MNILEYGMGFIDRGLIIRNNNVNTNTTDTADSTAPKTNINWCRI